MRVDSLKRPPTLLTIPSSFSASSMLSVSKLMLDKGVQVSDCRVQIVVDHLTIIMVSTGELLLGRRQSSLECPFILRATLSQAALVRLHLRASEEYQYAIGALPADGRGPLHIDIQDDADASISIRFHFSSQRAVALPVYLGPLEQCSAGNLGVKLLVGQKVVIHASALAGPRPSGSRRYRVVQRQIADCQQARDHRGLAAAARSRDD